MESEFIKMLSTPSGPLYWGASWRAQGWITNRPQYLGVKNCVSDTILCSTGNLFTLYTVNFTHNTTTRHLQKCSDDPRQREYREVKRNVLDWCQQNFLHINTGKTKELVVDFHRTKFSSPTPVNPQRRVPGCSSEQQTGLVGQHTHALYKKGQSRLHSEESFGYRVHSSTLFMTRWWHQPSSSDRKKLDTLTRKFCSGLCVGPSGGSWWRRMLAKLGIYNVLSRLANPSPCLISLLCGREMECICNPQEMLDAVN
ncbi:hypothetical protein NFI96_010018 [Prochilodus magdalenae]|nr:hypothetical protein NFI96_010018 [Prochilodus magdalenae]